jgi:hypothetical protein
MGCDKRDSPSVRDEATGIEPRRVRPGDEAGVLAVFDRDAQGLWGIGAAETRAPYDPLDDLDDPMTCYARPDGVFLVVTDAGASQGPAASRHLAPRWRNSSESGSLRSTAAAGSGRDS